MLTKEWKEMRKEARGEKEDGEGRGKVVKVKLTR